MCVGCITNADCDSTAPTCDAGTGTCVACQVGLCPTGQECNTSTGLCELLPQPLGTPCSTGADCLSSICWDAGTGARCARSCNSPADCDNGTTCYMHDGARLCLSPAAAPATAEDIDCTLDDDCPGSDLCVWVEDAPGHFDEVCRAPLGTRGPQSTCLRDDDCQNGICTEAVNLGGAYCRYTCGSDDDCPNNFSCFYVEYYGQSYVQAVKVCLPLEGGDPPVCGIDGDCDVGEVCEIFDDGTFDGFHYQHNECGTP